jgi:hypothetical protein
VSEILDNLFFEKRQVIIDRAKNSRCQKDLEHWFLSVFWDELETPDIKLLSTFLQRPEISSVLGDNLAPNEVIKPSLPSLAARAVA